MKQQQQQTTMTGASCDDGNKSAVFQGALLIVHCCNLQIPQLTMLPPDQFLVTLPHCLSTSA
jgi:hypothetical protein